MSTRERHMACGKAIGEFEDKLAEFKQGTSDSFAQMYSEYGYSDGYELLAQFARDLAEALDPCPTTPRA